MLRPDKQHCENKLLRIDQGHMTLTGAPSKTFNIIIGSKYSRLKRENFWVTAHKSILIKHQGKIQHSDGTGNEKQNRKESFLVGKNKKNYEGKLKVKCIKA